MTDIIERLRVKLPACACEVCCAICGAGREAANEIEKLRAICQLFSDGAHDAVRALNAAGVACPASIALAAEKARNALEEA